MAEQRHLNKPPIIEAVIELRFPKQIDWADSFKDSHLSEYYPDVKEVHSHLVEIKSDADFAIEKKMRAGWQFTNPSENMMVRLIDNKAIFIKLAPYNDWEQLEFGIELLLQVLLDAGFDQKISRLGTRFINKIPIARGDVELNDYLIDGPEFPEITEFLVRFLVKSTHFEKATNCEITRLITVETDPDPSIEHKLVVDIDAFSRDELGLEIDLLKAKLGQLRELKNRAFFRSVTEKSLESLDNGTS